jgi:hypothetical protein
VKIAPVSRVFGSSVRLPDKPDNVEQVPIGQNRPAD